MNDAPVFSVGDRVIGTGIESGRDIRGMTGTIVFATGNECSVEFDEASEDFHSCGGRTKKHHGLYCLSNVLESYCDPSEWELGSDLGAILL